MHSFVGLLPVPLNDSISTATSLQRDSAMRMFLTNHTGRFIRSRAFPVPYSFLFLFSFSCFCPHPPIHRSVLPLRPPLSLVHTPMHRSSHPVRVGPIVVSPRPDATSKHYATIRACIHGSVRTSYAPPRNFVRQANK